MLWHPLQLFAEKSINCWDVPTRRNGTFNYSAAFKISMLCRYQKHFYSISFISRIVSYKILNHFFFFFFFVQKFQVEQTSLDSSLCELLQVASVTLNSHSATTTLAPAGDEDVTRDVGTTRITLSKTRMKLCSRCRRYTSIDGEICPSCSVHCQMTINDDCMTENVLSTELFCLQLLSNQFD